MGCNNKVDAEKQVSFARFRPCLWQACTDAIVAKTAATVASDKKWRLTKNDL
jgi:hypothetical protein